MQINQVFLENMYIILNNNYNIRTKFIELASNKPIYKLNTLNELLEENLNLYNNLETVYSQWEEKNHQSKTISLDKEHNIVINLINELIKTETNIILQLLEIYKDLPKELEYIHSNIFYSWQENTRIKQEFNAIKSDLAQNNEKDKQNIINELREKINNPTIPTTDKKLDRSKPKIITPTPTNLSNKTKIAAGAAITSALAASGVGGYAAYQKFIKTVKVEGFTDKFSNLINQTAFGTVSSNPILKDLATKPEYSKLLDALKTQDQASLQSFLTNNSIEKIQSTITTLNEITLDGKKIALEAIKNEKLSALFAGNGLNFPGLKSKDFGSLFSKGQLDKYTTNPKFINQFSQVKDLEGLNTLLNNNNFFSPNQKNILRQLIDKNPEQFAQLQETLKQISTLNKNDLQLLSDVLGKPEALTLLNGSSMDFLQMSADPQIQALFADSKILELMQKQEFTQLLNNAGLSEVLNHSQLSQAMNSSLLSKFNETLSIPSATTTIGVAVGLLGLSAILGALTYSLFKSDKKEKPISNNLTLSEMQDLNEINHKIK